MELVARIDRAIAISRSMRVEPLAVVISSSDRDELEQYVKMVQGFILSQIGLRTGEPDHIFGLPIINGPKTGLVIPLEVA